MSDVGLPSFVSARVRRELAQLLELDLRDAEMSRAELARRCQEAVDNQCFAVCVAGSLVAHAASFLEATSVKVVAAVAFPSGNSDADVKRFEAEVAIDNGAQIIEAVANVGRILEQDESYLVREVRDIVEAADERPVAVALPARVVRLPELEWLLPKLVDTGIRGVTLSLAPASLDAALPVVQRACALLGAEIGVKVEFQGLKSSQIAELLHMGAVRFGTANLDAYFASLAP